MATTATALASVIVMGWLSGCASPLKQGIQLEQQGEYAQAIAVYEKIAATKPGTPAAHQAQLRIADAYANNLSQPDKAVEAWTAVASAAPKSDEGLTARYRLGLHHFKAEEYDQAATQFSGVLNDSPMTKFGADAQLMLAKTYEVANRLEEAEQTYNAFSQLHANDPNAPAALLSRAKILEQTGKQAEAVQTLQRVVRDFGANAELAQQVEIARQQLQSQGESVPQPVVETPATMTREQRLAERREAVRQRDRTAEAQQEAAQQAATSVFGVNADDLLPQMGSSGDAQGTRYDAMFMMAVAMYQSEMYREAGALYERAIQLAEEDRNRKGAWENLGSSLKGLADVYGKLGLHDRATELIKQAFLKDPNVVDQVIDSGLVDYGAGEYQKAIDTWTSIIGISQGKDAQIFYNMALAYQKLGDTPSEVQYLERAIAANPTYRDALQNMAATLYYRAGQRKRSYVFQDAVEEKGSYATSVELASLAFKYGYYLNAQSQFNLAIRQGQTDAEKAYASAMKAVSQGRKGSGLEQATTDLAAIVAANPDNDRVRYAAGLHAVTQKDTATAEAEFKKSLELNPSNTDALTALASIYMDAGDTAAALAVYDAYLKVNPTDRAMQQVREQVKIAGSAPK